MASGTRQHLIAGSKKEKCEMQNTREDRGNQTPKNAAMSVTYTYEEVHRERSISSGRDKGDTNGEKGWSSRHAPPSDWHEEVGRPRTLGTCHLAVPSLRTWHLPPGPHFEAALPWQFLPASENEAVSESKPSHRIFTTNFVPGSVGRQGATWQEKSRY